MYKLNKLMQFFKHAWKAGGDCLDDVVPNKLLLKAEKYYFMLIPTEHLSYATDHVTTSGDHFGNSTNSIVSFTL